MEINRHTKFADLPEFLTPEEFGSFLGIGKTSVYELVRTEAIPFRRFGRLIRIPRRAVNEEGCSRGE